jgi:hypothetical protein
LLAGGQSNVVQEYDVKAIDDGRPLGEILDQRQ